MPVILIAVDASIVKPGVALFVDRVLVRAARVRAPSGFADLEPARRCAAVAGAILDDASTWSSAWGASSRWDLVTEWPQVDRRTRKINPRDLFWMAGVGAALAMLCGGTRSSPTPTEWIGGLPKVEGTGPKVWLSPRGARVKARLEPAEIAAVELNDDAVDAVGLGLWALGRFDRKRVFPGAT